MTIARLLALVSILLATTGCFRTVYHHLEPPSSYQPPTPTPRGPREDSSWQPFFLWGWAPSERVIDAAFRCGGVARVQEIRTEQSFLQGFIAAIAGYYINIYSPYTGEVVCVGSRRE